MTGRIIAFGAIFYLGHVQDQLLLSMPPQACGSCRTLPRRMAVLQPELDLRSAIARRRQTLGLQATENQKRHETQFSHATE